MGRLLHEIWQRNPHAQESVFGKDDRHRYSAQNLGEAEDLTVVFQPLAPDDSQAWASAVLEQLHNGGGTALVAQPKQQLAARRGQPRATLQDLINYLVTKVDLMNYPDDRRRGWQIGAGMIESTASNSSASVSKAPSPLSAPPASMAMEFLLELPDTVHLISTIQRLHPMCNKRQP